MIVKIAACLYILQAALSLWSLSLSPFGPGSTLANLLVFAVSGLFAAMGAGLLMKAPWARWLALGSSLLGWTLGTLVFFGLIVLLFALGEILGTHTDFAGALFTGGLGAFFSFMLFLFALLFIACIVISFKLYFYLRSEEGAAEFGVEVESLGSVMASVGAWFALAIVQGMVGGGEVSSYMQADAERQEAETAEKLHIEQTRELVRQQSLLQQQQAQLERERAAMEEQQTRALATSRESSGIAQAEEPAVRYEPTVIESAPAAEAPAQSGILKCRDAAGAVQYTQGYCPPGTTRVEMQSNY